jgi:natural product precursor
MTISKFKLEDFESEKLSKKEQKTIHGGDDTDPAKTGGNGNGCF